MIPPAPHQESEFSSTRHSATQFYSRSLRLLGGVVAILFCAMISSAVAAVVDAGEPNGTDDTATLQSILDNGNVVSLRSGKTYRVTSQLLITGNNSGIICSGSTPAKLLLPAGAFDNPEYENMHNPAVTDDSMVIYASDVTNIQLENFGIIQTHQDGTWVTAIRLRAVSNCTIKDVEIANFSLGSLIVLDSVNNVSIRECWIHDSWANSHFSTSKLPQLTGINVDDNKVNGAGSTHVVITNTTISKLRFQDNLYQTPGSTFGYSGPIISFQTDGITLSPGGKGTIVACNFIDTVGEGIDVQSSMGLIESNLITNSFHAGLKFVHGANRTVARGNSIIDTGSWGVVMAGSASVSHNTYANFITGNLIEDSGRFAAYIDCDPEFVISVPSIWLSTQTGHSFRIMGMGDGPNVPGIRYPSLTIFFGNSIVENSESKLDHPFVVDENYSLNTLCYGNLYTDFSSGSPRHNVLYNGSSYTWIAANSTARYESPVYGAIVDAQASASVREDFNGDGNMDNLVTWASAGSNALYLTDFDDTTTIINNPIPTGGINGNPTNVLGGDFNGDGYGDVLFYWKATGQNRLYKGSSNGAFTQVLDPIPTNMIANSPDNVLVGDYNGDGKKDIAFIWKYSGANNIYYGSSGGFTGYTNPISTGGINGNPDYTLTGDFDGDGKSDLLFYWKNGVNRFRFGGSAGTFASSNSPIGESAINGSSTRVVVFDANSDGTEDLNFVWDASGTHRLFLSQTNRVFQFD